MTKSPVLLCILDGVGLSSIEEGNAVLAAKTPVLDALHEKFPHAQLRTDGEYVGLPEGQMGNSEVGHITIGSGRIIRQSLDRISHDLKHGTFSDLAGFKNFIQASKSCDSFHLIGLLSDGGVHGHSHHALGICEILDKLGKPVFVHAIADGRDVGMHSGKEHFAGFAKSISHLKNVHLATVIGRYYAMDRDNRWDRTEAAWRLFTELKGDKYKTSSEAFDVTYGRGEYDEYVMPSVLELPGHLDARIKDNDAVLMFNFRSDRMRQITRCFLGEKVGFDCVPRKLAAFATMTSYDESFDPSSVHLLYPPEVHANTLGQVISAAGKTQLRIAETEKFPHVTFFFNAGLEEPFAMEDRILVPSPKDVKSYDLKPEMSLPEVTDKIVEAIKSGKYDFIALNIANGDLVGHCGDFDAAVKSIEAVDHALSRIIPAIQAANGEALVIADHGNAEEMIVDGKPSTAHSTNPVSAIYVGKRPFQIQDGGLRDIAPTILSLMGLEIPSDMTGTVLLKKVGAPALG